MRKYFVYGFGGLLMPVLIWAIIVLSRMPLSGRCDSVESLPNHVALPSVYADCPISNVRWHFSDSFTGVFVVVADAEPAAFQAWVTSKKKAKLIRFCEVDSSTNTEVFEENADRALPEFAGTTNGKRYSEIYVGGRSVVIMSRKW